MRIIHNTGVNKPMQGYTAFAPPDRQAQLTKQRKSLKSSPILVAAEHQ